MTTLIQRNGRFKWLLSMSAIPFATLGTGFLVYFRHAGSHVGYLVMCQILNGLSGTIESPCTQLAVMADLRKLLFSRRDEQKRTVMVYSSNFKKSHAE